RNALPCIPRDCLAVFVLLICDTGRAVASDPERGFPCAHAHARARKEGRVRSPLRISWQRRAEAHVPIEQQGIVLLVLCCHLSAHRVVTLSLTSTLPLIALEYGQTAWAALTMSSALA